MRKIWIVTIAASLMLPAIVSAKNRLPRECRREVAQLCGMTLDRNVIRKCLRDKSSQLSDGCQSKIMKRLVERSAKTSAQGAQQTARQGGREVSYGAHAKQRLDYFPASGNAKAPLVVFIHGGGWSIGDKRERFTKSSKAKFYNDLGYSFASINYRLVPVTQPDGQAADVAKALAYLRNNSGDLGFDPDAIVLMGHSAGAHLAALVSSDGRYLDQAGFPLSAIKGTILLDSAAYNMPRLMQKPSPRKIIRDMYEAAFSNDVVTQKRLSPIAHVSTPNAPEWLILHVATRAKSEAQSGAFSDALKQHGSHAEVIPVAGSTHMTVNRDASAPDSFVGGKIAAFLRTIL